MNEPKERKSKRWIWVLVATLVFLFFGCFCCTFVGPIAMTSISYSGMNAFSETAADMDKAYYEECENLTVDTECNTCCRERVHDGMAFGTVMNTSEYTCGCLGNP